MTRVIVVDDSHPVVLQLQEFFEKQMGFEVVATGRNGNEAVELFRQHQPDLITLDISMPFKNGLTALQEIRTEFPEARVMMISALRGKHEMVQSLKFGAAAYMEKPLMLKNEAFVQDFKASIQEALAA